MTTAEVKYRLHRPFGWIALTYCDIEFIGEDSYSLSNIWRNIKNGKRDSMDELIKASENKISEMHLDIDKTNAEYKSLKRWYRPWKTKEQKVMVAKVKSLLNSIDRENRLIEEYKENRFYSPYELVDKAHYMLNKNGFRLISHTRNGEECVDDIEIWER